MSIARIPLSYLTLLVYIFAVQCVHAKQHEVPHEEFKQIEFTGTAYAVSEENESDRVLYVEQHRIFQDSQGAYVSGEVVYRSAAGDVLATKELDFSSRQTLPELRFEDLRTNSTFETRNHLNASSALVKLSHYEGTSSDTSKVDIENLNRSVVDAGFDLFVSKHWENLLEGKRVKLDFLALTRASFYEFYLQKDKVLDDQVVIKLKPSSFLLGLVMEPVVLTYELASKRLLRFEGLTNIEKVVKGKAKGENYIARIEYVYPE